MKSIKRALLSVYDKTGLLGLAEVLHRHGVELVSTGGTGTLLRDAGFPVIDVSLLTGHAEAFGGRIKTLSFEISAALLFDRERDASEAALMGLVPIDLLVCNLYPFQQAYESGARGKDLIEQIDIGGVTLIRAAAKNAAAVTVLVDPGDYDAFAREMKSGAGNVSAEFRQRQMRKAYHHTADYDAAIATALDDRAGERSLRLSFVEGKPLRYGENPHQVASVYRQSGAPEPFRVLQGKELSYTNLLDLHAATTAVAGLEKGACAVVKHGNPCGLAVAGSPAAAFDAAWEGDPVSAFGSVVAFNCPIDVQTVGRFRLDHPDRGQRRFIEMVVAPEFAPGTAEALAALPSLRMVEWRGAGSGPQRTYHLLGPLLLCQDADQPVQEGLTSVTNLAFPPEQQDLANFGIQAVARVLSNAIVLVRRTEKGEQQLLGMGAGQPNRVTSVGLAIAKARENLAREAVQRGIEAAPFVASELGRAILVSDAFFPFPDSIDLCAEAGVRLVVQPGGSKRDAEVVARANERGIAMALTGRRHFRH